MDHLPPRVQAELQSRHPARHRLLHRHHHPDLPRLFLLQHAVPRHQRGRSHVGGHGAEPCAVPHAVFLHVAPDRAAGSAPAPDAEELPELHDRLPAPRAGVRHRDHPVLGRRHPVHAAGHLPDAHLRLLVPDRGLLPDRLRRREPRLPH